MRPKSIAVTYLWTAETIHVQAEGFYRADICWLGIRTRFRGGNSLGDTGFAYRARHRQHSSSGRRVGCSRGERIRRRCRLYIQGRMLMRSLYRCGSLTLNQRPDSRWKTGPDGHVIGGKGPCGRYQQGRRQPKKQHQENALQLECLRVSLETSKRRRIKGDE